MRIYTTIYGHPLYAERQEPLLWQPDCSLYDAFVSIEKSSQSLNDLDIHPRSSQLRTAYHFLFVDCCFNVFIYDYFQYTTTFKWTWVRDCLWPWELRFWQRSFN